MRLLLATLLFAIIVVPAFALPAHACSCEMPSDIKAWVDESEAAFVGTLVDKRDAGSDEFGGESIYVFEVEEWVKGDAGEVIEVRSASDGAACGFEFWDPDQRIGAIVHQENRELHGSLCSQVDPDVLLAAMAGAEPSSTGVGHLLAGNGWSSTRLTVLDEGGGHVTDLLPPGESRDFEGTQALEVCPGGESMLQLTPVGIHVWDLTTLAVVATHEVTEPEGKEWIAAASCRSEDASTIWAVMQSEFSSVLMNLPDRTHLLDLQGYTWKFGNDYILIQNEGEDDPIRTDIVTGEEILLHETPPGANWAINVAAHPVDDRVALVETRFSQGEGPVEATLFILDAAGETVDRFEIPWETYAPTWLDENRVAVNAYNFENWEESFGFVFDLSTGEMTEVPGWSAEYTIADGETLYGVNGGGIVTADLGTGTIETLVTLPTESAGPLVLLEEAPVVSATTTSTTRAFEPDPTTPPLVAPELGGDVDEPAGLQWIAGVAIFIFLGILVWLAGRPSDGGA